MSDRLKLEPEQDVEVPLSAQHEVTLMLRRWQDGDAQARDTIIEFLHASLQRMAHKHLAGQDRITLQPADLVQESILRLLGTEADYRDRTHLLATAALKVRAVLIDHIRAKLAVKRGGGAPQVSMTIAVHDVVGEQDPLEAFALHDALEKLAAFDLRCANVIEMTYFGGLSRKEIAMVLDISIPTVDRDLLFGRTWLARELDD